MGGHDVESISFGPVVTSRQQKQAAALHVADRIGAEHEHPLDELMPRLAGRLTGQNPDVKAQLLHLLDVLGLRKGLAEIEELQDREVGLEAELAIATAENQRLTGEQ